MLFCMKPTSKQLSAVKRDLVRARQLSELSNAEISRITGVDPSQVSRICGGQFKTFSFNVVQICKVFDIALPRVDVAVSEEDPSWAEVQTCMKALWDETPEGAKAISQMIKAVANVASKRPSSERAD